MQPSTIQPVFPLGRTLAVMTAVTAAVLLVEVIALPAVFGKPAGAVEAVLLMGGVVWLSAMIGVLPVKSSPAKGPMGVIAAYFKGMGIRWIAALAMMVVAIKSLNLPAGPVAVSLTVTSFAVIATEVSILKAFLKRFDVPTSTGRGNTVDKQDEPAKPQAAKDNGAANCVEVLA